MPVMKKHNDPEDIEQLIAEEVAAYEQSIVGRKRRPMREGETVDYSIIGVPGLVIKGPGIDVFEYPDGEIQPIVPNLMGLMQCVTTEILLRRTVMGTKEELRFVRQTMRLTQEELAERAGLARETISRIENGKLALSRSVWQAVRGVGFDFIFARVNDLPQGVREDMRSMLSSVQDLLSSMAEGINVELPERPATPTG